MPFLLERVVAEGQRQDRRDQPQRARRGEHRDDGHEPQQSEQNRDLNPAMHERGVGERPVGRKAHEPFLAGDLFLQDRDGRSHGLSDVRPHRSLFIERNRPLS